MIYELGFMVSDLEDKRGVVRRVSPSWLAEAIRGSLPEMAFLREEPRPPVPAGAAFWSSGLVPRKTRFGGAGTLCIWHVARGDLDFWPQNAGGARDLESAPAGRVRARAGSWERACIWRSIWYNTWLVAGFRIGWAFVAPQGT